MIESAYSMLIQSLGLIPVLIVVYFAFEILGSFFFGKK